MRNSRLIWLAPLCMLFCASCTNDKGVSSKSAPTPSNPYTAPPLITPVEKTLVIWQAQETKLKEAVKFATQLYTSTQAFLERPSDASLTHFERAWHDTVLATEAAVLGSLLGKSLGESYWQALNQITDRVIAWPAHSGYLGSLSSNNTHHHTGLIFDIGTPISMKALIAQHQLTGARDLTLGLYALGALLLNEKEVLINEKEALVNKKEGQDEKEQATFNNWLAINQLDDNQRHLGYEHPKELPQNRRRQLALLQSQQLLIDLKRWHQMWSKRDRHSLLNNFSQSPPQQQHLQYLTAMQQLSAQQVLELSLLKSATSEGMDKYSLSPMMLNVHNHRLREQQKSLEQWARVLEADELAELSQNVQALLSQHLEAEVTAITPPLTTVETVNEKGTREEGSTAGNKHSLHALLAKLTVDIKQTISKSAPLIVN